MVQLSCFYVLYCKKEEKRKEAEEATYWYAFDLEGRYMLFSQLLYVFEMLYKLRYLKHKSTQALLTF